jgi:hypothetical protein
MKTTFANKNTNVGIIELSIPQVLKNSNVNRIASEYGTLCVCYKDKTLRTTFNRNNIDTTVYSFHNKSISICMSRDLADAVRKFISDNWLILIGKGESDGK